MSTEQSVAAALAEVMVYNEGNKKWQPPPGSDGLVSKVEIMQHNHKPSFRIISVRDGQWLLNCNIHHKLKYHTATSTFHQWRDEHRQVYGLNFQSEADAQSFVSIVGQAIDYVAHHALSEYQQPHPNDNVYQDPHQHLMHIQSAPNFHDENQNANFRKISNLAQQQQQQTQRRVSQNSNGMDYHHHQHASSSSAVPMAPPMPAPTSSIPSAPPAPPPPPPAAASAGPSNLPPVSSNAPPPPPPPPPNFGAAPGAGKPTSLADQLKMRSQSLNKTTNGSAPAAPAKPEAEKPAPPSGAGNLMSELAAQIQKRKMTQAKADAVDSKSNTSNGSSDSGCGTATSTNGFSNGGSVGSAAAKKWSVSDVKSASITESPKTHRKLPSASSIFSQDDKPVVAENGTSTSSSSSLVNNELLERFRAELMVEVRLEINKAKQEIIEVIRQEFARR